MPDYSVRLGVFFPQLQEFGDSRGPAVPFFFRSCGQSQRGIAQEPSLPARLVAGVGVAGRYFMPADIHFGHGVASTDTIGAAVQPWAARHLMTTAGADIFRVLQEDCPLRNPLPELLGLVGVECQFVGLRGVALKESRLGLANVHHFEEPGIGQQFNVFVGAGGGRGDEAVL